MKRPDKLIPDLRWEDVDGDSAWFTTGRDEIGDTGNVAALEIKNGETGGEGAVYLSRDMAEQVISWLQDALARHEEASRAAS